MYKKPFVIAEIGCNHKGDFKIAKKMIDTAYYYCKVDCVKFQKRNPRELLSKKQYNAPHINPFHSYGKTYGEHREYLEFTLNQHKKLKKYCDNLGILYSTSVWDMTSAKQIISINPKLIKIPSAINTHYNMLEYIFKHYSGKIHISTGMTTINELYKIVNLSDKFNRTHDVILYHCTSGYPIQFKDANLLNIKTLNMLFGNKIKEIGYSGHHKGIGIDISAYTLGANYIERHFTLNRTWKGIDHIASLEPEGMRKLVRNLNNTYKSLTYKCKNILDVEVEQRKKLKYR
jgi:sialic acid synthase